MAMSDEGEGEGEAAKLLPMERDRRPRETGGGVGEWAKVGPVPALELALATAAAWKRLWRRLSPGESASGEWSAAEGVAPRVRDRRTGGRSEGPVDAAVEGVPPKEEAVEEREKIGRAHV